MAVAVAARANPRAEQTRARARGGQQSSQVGASLFLRPRARTSGIAAAGSALRSRGCGESTRCWAWGVCVCVRWEEQGQQLRVCVGGKGVGTLPAERRADRCAGLLGYRCGGRLGHGGVESGTAMYGCVNYMYIHGNLCTCTCTCIFLHEFLRVKQCLFHLYICSYDLNKHLIIAHIDVAHIMAFIALCM